MKFFTGMMVGAGVSMLIGTTPEEAVANWQKWAALLTATPKWLIFTAAAVIGFAGAFWFERKMASLEQPRK